MKKQLLLISILFSVLFISCTSVKVSTIKNENRKLTEVTGYLILCDFADIGLRTEFENGIVQKLTKRGKNAKESVVLFPPLKNYTALEIQNESIKNNLNAKIIISHINSTSETGYMYMSGVLVPVTSTNNCIDVIVQDLINDEIIMHSTVNTEGDSLKYIITHISEKIVTAVLNEECYELVPLLQNLCKDELQIIQISNSKYSIKGNVKLGDININNGNCEIKLPLAFSKIEDSKGIVEIINTNESSYCRIITNNKDDLRYISELLKQYNLTKNK